MFAQGVFNNFDPGFRQDGRPERPPYPRYGCLPLNYLIDQSGENNVSCQQTAFSSQAVPRTCSDIGCNCTDFDRWKKREVLPTIVEARSITVEEFDRMSAGTRNGSVYDANQETTVKGNFAFFAQGASRWGFDVGNNSTHHVSRETTRETTRNVCYRTALGLPYQSQTEGRPSTTAYITNHDGQACQPATGALHALCNAHKRFLHTWSLNDSDIKHEGLYCSTVRPNNEEQHATYVNKKVRGTKRSSPVSQVSRNATETYQEECTSAFQVHSANEASSLVKKTRQEQATAHDNQDNVTRDPRQNGGAGPVRLPPKKRRRLDDIVMKLKGSPY